MSGTDRVLMCLRLHSFLAFRQSQDQASFELRVIVPRPPALALTRPGAWHGAALAADPPAHRCPAVTARSWKEAPDPMVPAAAA